MWTNIIGDVMVDVLYIISSSAKFVLNADIFCNSKKKKIDYIIPNMICLIIRPYHDNINIS